MEFEDTVNQRHSIRNYSDKKVDPDIIRKIVEIAQKSPSWVDSQPTKVYVAKGKALDNIRTAYQKNDQAKIKSQPDLPVMHREDWNERTQENMQQWRHEIVHHFDDFDQAHTQMTGASVNLYHAPVILFITIPKNSSQWSIFDAGLFSQTLMLAAKNEGLDTIPNYTSVRFPDVVRKEISIPDDETLVVGVALGYASDQTINSFESSRKPVADILKSDN
ncbi:nitroreductase [Companilactobacillus halodurans]|uniref:Nitroreductase n=1 Tax=Companilactobacillus halodurans TaxID=2584183 RepID=A0A5P0ZX21_9LACO|nr:nitroreductase [Companilactobacillus halodurans]MQS76217.1 nitroreductase [Companilactobacillus halodurans]MQS97445.1 nitroreductase [Companilactobacillus halodurans]